MLKNILWNRIKFKLIHDTKETDVLEQKKDMEFYKVTVSDEGVCIPNDEEESIFDPFIQSTRTKTKA